MQAQAALENVQMEVPTKDRTAAFYVFTIADMIGPQVKSMNPDWEAGGLLRPESYGLKYKLGYVRRGEITSLRQQVISERASFIEPNERRHLHPTVRMHVGNAIVELGKQKLNINGRPTAEKGAESEGHDGLLRTIFYPQDEIDKLTGQMDGLVKMPCTNALEAAKAQYFLFPDWDNHLAGLASLPSRVSEIRAYFTGLQPKDELERAVRAAAIKSCNDYTSWGSIQTTAANAEFQAMAKKGYAWPFAPETEMLFDQLNLQRQDTVAQQQGDKLDRLTDSIAAFVEASLANNPTGWAPAAVTAPTAEVPELTPEELAMVFEARTAKLKAEKDAKEKEAKDAKIASIDAVLREGLVVRVAGELVTATGKKGGFGRIIVKAADGTEKQVDPLGIELVPED